MALVYAAAAFAQEQSENAAAGFVTVSGGRFLDPSGRELLLRGINIEEPAKNGLPDAEVKRSCAVLRESGCNVIRLTLSWAGLEPVQGRYDEIYLARLDLWIACAKENGLLVLLALEQDRFGGDSTPPFWHAAGGQGVEPPEKCAWAWQVLARRYAQEAAVIGYDPLDAPNPAAEDPGEFERATLMPFYRRIIEVIRAQDPRHILFLEDAGTMRGETASAFDTPAAGQDVRDTLQAFAPRLEPLPGAQSAALERIRRRCENVAKQRGLPLLVSAWKPDAANHLEQIPYGVVYANIEAPTLAMRKRPYPQAIAGTLLEYRANPSTGIFECKWKEHTAVSEPTCIYVPDLWYPNGCEISLLPLGAKYRLAPIASLDQSAYILIPPLGNATRHLIVCRAQRRSR